MAQAIAGPSLNGYNRKPVAVSLWAACFCLLPLFSYVLDPVHQSMGLSQYREYLRWYEVAAAFAAAAALWTVTRLSLWVFVGLCVSVVSARLGLAAAAQWQMSVASGAETLLWAAAPALILGGRVRVAYLDPETRWWKRAPRYAHPSFGVLYASGIKFPIVVMNVSMNGAFVKLDERIFSTRERTVEEDRRLNEQSINPFVKPEEILLAYRHSNLYPMTVGAEISLVVQTRPGLDSPYPKGSFEVNARVVWHTKATDTYRYGIGLYFLKHSWPEKLRLARYLRLFDPVPSSRPVQPS